MSHFGALAAASSRYAALCNPTDPRGLPWYWSRLHPQIAQDRSSPNGKKILKPKKILNFIFYCTRLPCCNSISKILWFFKRKCWMQLLLLKFWQCQSCTWIVIWWYGCIEEILVFLKVPGLLERVRARSEEALEEKFASNRCKPHKGSGNTERKPLETIKVLDH